MSEIGPRYYDRGGRPIALERWTELLDDPEYRHVAETWVGRYRISTVWLGLDHGFSFLGDPHLIFETMIFDRTSGDPYPDLEMRRYSTEAAARTGHEDMVALVRALEDVDQPEKGSTNW